MKVRNISRYNLKGQDILSKNKTRQNLNLFYYISNDLQKKRRNVQGKITPLIITVKKFWPCSS